MKTISLRFGETFSPDCGTIQAHKEVINKIGYVWYGKTGATISDERIKLIKQNKVKKILLIASGTQKRYWAYFEDIQKTTPKDGIPSYYAGFAEKFHTWFKITRIENAPKDIIGHCVVVSSQSPLGTVSKHSMNPCFFIECPDDIYLKDER